MAGESLMKVPLEVLRVGAPSPFQAAGWFEPE